MSARARSLRTGAISSLAEPPRRAAQVEKSSSRSASTKSQSLSRKTDSESSLNGGWGGWDDDSGAGGRVPPPTPSRPPPQHPHRSHLPRPLIGPFILSLRTPLPAPFPHSAGPSRPPQRAPSSGSDSSSARRHASAEQMHASPGMAGAYSKEDYERSAARKDDFFASKMAQNASRPDYLPPNQGGKYVGFGSAPPGQASSSSGGLDSNQARLWPPLLQFCVAFLRCGPLSGQGLCVFASSLVPLLTPSDPPRSFRSCTTRRGTPSPWGSTSCRSPPAASRAS